MGSVTVKDKEQERCASGRKGIIIIIIIIINNNNKNMRLKLPLCTETEDKLSVK